MRAAGYAQDDPFALEVGDLHALFDRRGADRHVRRSVSRLRVRATAWLTDSECPGTTCSNWSLKARDGDGDIVTSPAAAAQPMTRPMRSASATAASAKLITSVSRAAPSAGAKRGRIHAWRARSAATTPASRASTPPTHHPHRNSEISSESRTDEPPPTGDKFPAGDRSQHGPVVLRRLWE